MKNFKGELTLNKNSRGCYILDTIKGCSIVNTKPRGCYGDCYAMSIARRYNFDFGTPIKREFTEDNQINLFGFKDSEHMREIISAIRKIDMPFVRIGEMGDPSEDWEHTLSIVEQIKEAKKPIVIITKHWTPIPAHLLRVLEGVCINTSVSALDSQGEIQYRLGQYERLKEYCNSVLRIVSCDFNLENEEGCKRAEVQKKLFENENTLDTVFRPSAQNEFLTSGVINAKPRKFLKAMGLASVYNEKTYFGNCTDCPDMCGLTLPQKPTEATA